MLSLVKYEEKNPYFCSNRDQKISINNDKIYIIFQQDIKTWYKKYNGQE